MVAKSSVIILDEPTSGLDNKAARVLNILKKITNHVYAYLQNLSIKVNSSSSISDFFMI